MEKTANGPGDAKKGGWAGWPGWTVALLVAAGAAYLAAPRGGDAAKAAPGGTKKGGFAVVDDAPGARVLLAAARPDEIPPPDASSPLRRLPGDRPSELSARDAAVLAGASASGALYVGPEKFNDTWKELFDSGKVGKDAALFGHPDAAYPGFARYRFRAPEAGSYEIWVRAYWVDDCGNSVDLSLDGGPLFTLTDSNVGHWAWRRLRTGEGAARRFRFEAGSDHVLTLCNREDDLYLDQILLRPADAGLPDPVGVEKP